MRLGRLHHRLVLALVLVLTVALAVLLGLGAAMVVAATALSAVFPCRATTSTAAAASTARWQRCSAPPRALLCRLALDLAQALAFPG